MTKIENKRFVSKDGVEYVLSNTKDVIELTDEQIESIKSSVEKMDSDRVTSTQGIDLVLWRAKQSKDIIDEVSRILRGCDTVDDIINAELFLTEHSEVDRISDREVMIKRKWDPDNTERQIAHCLKTCYKAEKVRIRFDKNTRKSWNTFSFIIWGFKDEDKTPGELVIYFEKDPDPQEDKIIKVVTVLTY